MVFEGHLCMTRIAIPTFLSKSTMQKDRVKSGDLHRWSLTNWYPTSPDAEGVTFSKPCLVYFSIYVRGNSGMNLLLFTVLNIGFNKKHPIGFNKKHPTSLLSSYHIYIILVVGGVLSLKHPIGMCVDQFQFLHLQCLMSPSLSQSSNQKWMRFH